VIAVLSRVGRWNLRTTGHGPGSRSDGEMLAELGLIDAGALEAFAAAEDVGGVDEVLESASGADLCSVGASASAQALLDEAERASAAGDRGQARRLLEDLLAGEL